MKTTGPTNPEMLKLIVELRKQKKDIYRDIAKHLAKPSRKKEGVNLSKIERIAKKDENVVIPGKVLSGGKIVKSINVYAFSYAKSAEDKIRKAGGKALKINDLLENKENARIII